jgi:hypothetical protein
MFSGGEQMNRAVVRNGVVQPLEPLPADWNDGRQVVVEEMEPCTLEAGEVDRWSSEMSDLTAALNDAEEWQEIETALAEADRGVKSRCSSCDGLP